jgi:hypothetical protein
LQQLLYRFTGGANLEREQKILSDVLADQLKLSFDRGVFDTVSLTTEEQYIASQFTIHANYYSRIWKGLGMQGAFDPSQLQTLAPKIAKRPYYYGAYAAEIDRVGKAFATNEIACVREYDESKNFTEQTCKHGVSMESVPTGTQQPHPHPVAEFFDAGMVMIQTHLLRRGHNVRAVPYLQRIDEGEFDKFPWPLSPAMEITFLSGKVFYHPAKILWLDYSSLKSDVASTSEPTQPLSTFAERLLQRSKMLCYLPAIAIVKLNERKEVEIERSHDESVPPVAIISVTAEGVQVTATLNRSTVQFGRVDPKATAWKMIEDRIENEFNGFCPKTWTLASMTPPSDKYHIFYMVERICLGLSPDVAASGEGYKTDTFRKFATGESKLFGIPE